MGLLWAKLWKLFGTEEYKIIIVGLDNAGKTTILYQLSLSIGKHFRIRALDLQYQEPLVRGRMTTIFLMNEVVHTSPTIGSNVEEVKWRNVHFVMWDIGGQESLRQAWSTYYTGTHFMILVVDSTDRERLTVAKEELYKMLGHEELSRAGVLIFANKQDVKGSMSAAEISQHLNLTSIKDHGWHIQSCCALTGEGLYQGLEWILAQTKST